ncbi:Haloacetate dehalogenase H-2 [Aquisphaera giovannonii]|uniref:Haloacetate dehalogenase H-2 n=1 Tax=Aquisphaera giovannonii TaxID=406548 RepID=A0A5B9W044_9BACT|nr:haloacid dehalogenase type II [Aquisphaera giovannonii]QEH33405.1 Haloacetate dehalogenase H-2 [Aquisphaera giovannonii]
MSIHRRVCIQRMAGGLAAGTLDGPAFGRRERGRIKAIAFDAFPVLDPRPVSALAESLFPGRGEALSAAWRIRQFEYQWLRLIGGKYEDFLKATDASLAFAARSLGLVLTGEKRRRLTGAFLELRAWPDAAGALKALREDGVRLAFLSNATPAILRAGVEKSGLAGVFEHVLSTDAIRSYKPDPRAYRMAQDAFRLPREEVLFAAFAGWDVAGAKWFGYPVFWVNRLGAPMEELGEEPDGAGRGLDDLVAFVRGRNS